MAVLWLSVMDEDSPGRKGNTIVPLTFFSDPDACGLWNGGVSLLLYTRAGQDLMCFQSKLSFLGMPAAMRSKRKGKQTLKWVLKPSLWCSENKSLFAAKKKKKINWQWYSLSFHCIPCLHSHLYSIRLFRKLTQVKTQQHTLSGAITWLAGGSSLLVSSHNSPRSPVFQHGGGYGTGMARPPCIPLLDQGVRPHAGQASGTALSRGRARSIRSTMGTWLRVPLPWVGFGHSMAAGWLRFGQGFPIIAPLPPSSPFSCKLHRSGALFFCWAIYNIKSNNK